MAVARKSEGEFEAIFNASSQYGEARKVADDVARAMASSVTIAAMRKPRLDPSLDTGLMGRFVSAWQLRSLEDRKGNELEALRLQVVRGAAYDRKSGGGRVRWSVGGGVQGRGS